MRPDPSQKEYTARLLAHYRALNAETGLAARILNKSHTLLEKTLPRDYACRNVLEVGSGTFPHVNFLEHDYEEYVVSDVLPIDLRDLTLFDHVDRDRIRSSTADATNLSFADGTFDRLIAAHTLEHLPEPYRVLREWHRVLAPGGLLSLILPCDPGIAWRLGRWLGPKRKAESLGIEYDYWMAREHVNPISNLTTFIDYYFPDRKAAWWPFRHIPSIDLNLVYTCHIRKAA